MSDQPVVTGGCHCGRARFEISGPMSGFVHCHCRTCRRINGTVYGSSAVVARADFRLVSDPADLAAYDSSPGKRRLFCRHCGAHVYAEKDRTPDIVLLRMGTLDGPFEVRPERHIWVSHKPDWYEIRDDLPQDAEQGAGE